MITLIKHRKRRQQSKTDHTRPLPFSPGKKKHQTELIRLEHALIELDSMKGQIKDSKIILDARPKDHFQHLHLISTMNLNGDPNQVHHMKETNPHQQYCHKYAYPEGCFRGHNSVEHLSFQFLTEQETLVLSQGT